MSEKDRESQPAVKVSSSSADNTTVGDVVDCTVSEVKLIGEYQLIRKIGGGGMGVVYEALHSRLKRRVAVKLISESALSDPDAQRRFFREMEAAGRLEHPHIVQATDAGVVDGVPYLVMELVQGSDLSRVVRQNGALPPLAALQAIEQTALALDHIHSHGMSHRDIKPSNLLLSNKGIVKVADLGVAHLLVPLAETDDVTGTGDFIGTVDYMAPEQAQNAKHADQQADIYSLGCCLHFLLYGTPVYSAGSRVDRLISHRADEIPDLTSRSETPLPRSLQDLFQDMLAKDPRNRPVSVQECLVRLRTCGDDLRALCATVAPQARHRIAGESLPILAGLDEVARAVFAKGWGRSDDQHLQPTLMAGDWAEHRPSRRNAAIGGVALLAVVVALALSYRLKSPPPQDQPSANSTQPETATDGKPPTKSAAPALVTVLNAHPAAAVFHVHFSDDGRHLLSCGSDGAIRVWDVATRQKTGEMQHDRGPDGRHVIDVVLLPNSRLAVSACYSGLAVVWDWAESRRVRQFERHRNQVEGVAWVSGTRVLTTGRDDSIFLWDANNGEVQSQLENSHQGGVRAVAVSADGRRAVTGDYNGILQLWSLETGNERPLEALQPVNEAISVWCLAWVGETSRVAIGGVFASGQSLLVVYDTAKHEVVRRYTNLTGRVYGVRASHDGLRLYSAADDVLGWSLDADAPLFEFTAHDDNAFCVDESPDGELLATGGTDGTVRIFPWRDVASRLARETARPGGSGF